MFLKKFKGATRTSLFIAALLASACSPVKFSVPQEDFSSQEPPSSSGTFRDVHLRSTLAPQDNKLDIILIVDDSNSMLPDNQKLAAHLAGFVTKLQSSNIDWQMCATVTRALPISATQSAWGASIYWQNSNIPSSDLGMVLKKGTANLSTIFAETINYINAGWLGSDDERAIKAAYQHAYNGDYRFQPNSGCYRPDSAIAYIIISDEDERSIGGDSTQQVYASELKALEEEDKPEVFVAFIRDTFGANRRFTVNSIIVKPEDSSCKESQDSGGVKSHYGFIYAELSKLTGGGIGSICATDYSTSLNLFLSRIQDSLRSVPLECQPYNGNINITVMPNMGPVKSRVEGLSLVFDTPIPAGHTIDVSYKCLDNGRSPASKGAPIAPSLSFWARLKAFFTNLF